jgi:hypothetical protein
MSEQHSGKRRPLRVRTGIRSGTPQTGGAGTLADWLARLLEAGDDEPPRREDPGDEQDG